MAESTRRQFLRHSARGLAAAGSVLILREDARATPGHPALNGAAERMTEAVALARRFPAAGAHIQLQHGQRQQRRRERHRHAGAGWLVFLVLGNSCQGECIGLLLG